MDYIIQPTPALDDSVDEDTFIDLNLAALEGEWTLSETGLRVVLESDTLPGHVAHSNSVGSSRGVVYLQVAKDGKMHIEYLMDLLRGCEIRQGDHALHDNQIADAFRSWYETRSQEIDAVVRERAGELR